MIRGLCPHFFILKYEHVNNDSYDNVVNVPGEYSYHNRIRWLTKLHHGVGGVLQKSNRYENVCACQFFLIYVQNNICPNTILHTINV